MNNKTRLEASVYIFLVLCNYYLDLCKGKANVHFESSSVGNCTPCTNLQTSLALRFLRWRSEKNSVASWKGMGYSARQNTG